MRSRRSGAVTPGTRGGGVSAPLATAYSPAWLDLREVADAAARATALLDPLHAALAEPPLVIRDLGCGTGSMGRWLAGRLPGPQRWILHDRDPELLALAVERIPETAADGAAVTAEPGRRDITGLSAGDIAGTSLVTCSALLDLLTADEVTGLAAACAGTPALLALSVSGSVALLPADPFDSVLAGAFDEHQRRTAGGRRLLGPDAADAATAAFEGLGATVHRQPSPWRLGPEHAALAAEWLRGRVAAAVEQRPDLAPEAERYLDRRLAACAAGHLRVVVGHEDLLAVPSGGAA